MAWESRRNGKRYYYTKRRLGRKVISEYHGRGEHVAVIEGLISETKLERQEQRRLRLELKESDSVMSDYLKAMRLVIATQLEADGYKYHRGEWRKPSRQTQGV